MLRDLLLITAALDHLTPPFLEGDFDGDGGRDLVAPVWRTEDGKRALAFCHPDRRRLDLVGLD